MQNEKNFAKAELVVVEIVGRYQERFDNRKDNQGFSVTQEFDNMDLEIREALRKLNITPDEFKTYCMENDGPPKD